jgi:hypothetical protein
MQEIFLTKFFSSLLNCGSKHCVIALHTLKHDVHLANIYKAFAAELTKQIFLFYVDF